MVAGLGAAGCATCVYFLRLPVAWIYPAVFLEGSAQLLVQVPTDAIMAEITPHDKPGRVFGVFGTLSHATAIPGWWLAASLVETFGAAFSIGAVGILLALVRAGAPHARLREAPGRPAQRVTRCRRPALPVGERAFLKTGCAAFSPVGVRR